MQCLLRVQSGAVPCDQVERGPQEIICCFDKRAQVYPKEGQEHVAGFGVRLVYSLAISAGDESEVAPRRDEWVSIPLRFVVVAQPIYVQLQGAIVASEFSKKDSSCLKEVYADER